ncbi:cyclin-dependent kinases regulatory subunit 1 [Populus alba x Populus x berolinensis]|nr:cyclin-dependent kinases regulatory subunit 1 [Populus alba x Populus x berolinensis]
MGQIQYSEKYFDDTFEYRHVVLPPEVAKLLPKNRLLSESEWRAIGVQQSRGWVHYAIHRPEPHIMLFRRPLNFQQQQENQIVDDGFGTHFDNEEAFAQDVSLVLRKPLHYLSTYGIKCAGEKAASCAMNATSAITFSIVGTSSSTS